MRFEKPQETGVKHWQAENTQNVPRESCKRSRSIEIASDGKGISNRRKQRLPWSNLVATATLNYSGISNKEQQNVEGALTSSLDIPVGYSAVHF